MIYSEEIQFLKRVEESGNSQNERRILSRSEIDTIQENFKTVSEEYLCYLAEIGAGSFRECQFIEYENLIDIKSIGLDEYFDVPQNIRFFGDNFSGDLSGFILNKNDGIVLELWHDSGELYQIDLLFKDYIREQMLMSFDGKDLRGM